MLWIFSLFFVIMVISCSDWSVRSQYYRMQASFDIIHYVFFLFRRAYCGLVGLLKCPMWTGGHHTRHQTRLILTEINTSLALHDLDLELQNCHKFVYFKRPLPAPNNYPATLNDLYSLFIYVLTVKLYPLVLTSYGRNER